MSDIRKIQTGNNQYTLHARVSDKLAIMCSSTTQNTLNYPFHRILKTDIYTDTTSWRRNGITLYLSDHYTGKDARFGIVDIEFAKQGSQNSVANIVWIVRSGFRIDDIQAGLFATPGGTYMDVYLKTRITYGGTAIQCISEGDIATESNPGYTFINSQEVANTTTTDKKTSVEVYKTIAEAATQLHGKAYTSIITPTDASTVANANYAQNIGTNKSHPQIGSSTTPVYVDNTGKIKACDRDIPTVDTVMNATSTNAIQNKAVFEALKAKADTSALNNYLTKTDAGNTYAKKDDISKVYKYKGTKTTYSALPTTGNTIGDVWNITNEDTANHIKAGDNVVWDGSKWDNLSGTVDLSNYLQKGGSQTTTSTADGGSNVYTFKDGSTITVKNGSKGSTGAAATWFSGGVVTGTSTTAKSFPVSGSKAGDMYLNTGTGNVYEATTANMWAYVCNIKGSPGTNGNNGTTPTIKAAAGGNINSVGTPTVSATTNGITTTFTFDNLKGQKGDKGATGATVTWHTGTAISKAGIYTIPNAKLGDMYLNTTTCDVFKAGSQQQTALSWGFICNIKGVKGDAADIPTLAKGVAGIVPGTINDNLSASRWLNGGDNGTGAWRALPTAGGNTSGMVRTCKDYSGSIDPTKISGYAHGTTPPSIQPITTGASDYRGVESDGSGRLFVNVPAYEKNISRTQNTVLAAPTSGAGTATFRKLTSSDIPWNERFKVMTPAQYKASTKLTNVFYFILEE